MQDLIKTIDEGFERRDTLTGGETDLIVAIEKAIDLLDSGEARVAEKIGDDWKVNHWLKKAVLLSFRFSNNQLIDGGHMDLVLTGFVGLVRYPFAIAGYDRVVFVDRGLQQRGRRISVGQLQRSSQTLSARKRTRQCKHRQYQRRVHRGRSPTRSPLPPHVCSSLVRDDRGRLGQGDLPAADRRP